MLWQNSFQNSNNFDFVFVAIDDARARKVILEGLNTLELVPLHSMSY